MKTSRLDFEAWRSATVGRSEGAAPFSPGGQNDLAQRVCDDVGQGEIGARIGESERDLPAQPACRPRDDRDAAGQVMQSADIRHAARYARSPVAMISRCDMGAGSGGEL